MNQKQKEFVRWAHQWVREHEQEMIEELRGLVRIPSVAQADLAAPGAPYGPHCRQAHDYMLARGRHYGFQTVDHDGYVGEIIMGDPDDALGYAVHVDVVPVIDEWRYPPFELTFLPEKRAVVGRGVTDDKGPAIMCLFVMRMLREYGWPLKHGIRLMFGSSEEPDMSDFIKMREMGIPFPKVSLTPDTGFPVNNAQKGLVRADLEMDCVGNLVEFESGSVRNIIPHYARCVLRTTPEAAREALSALEDELISTLEIEACEQGVQIAAHGISVHAAFPEGGVNAISLLCRALFDAHLLEGSCVKAIEKLKDLTSDVFGYNIGAGFEDEITGKLTLVYTVAHLKDGVLMVGCDSRIPVRCSVNDMAGKMKAEWTRRGFRIADELIGESVYIPPEDERVVTLQNVYHALTGTQTPPFSSSGGNYARVIPNTIPFGIQTPGLARNLGLFPEGQGGPHTHNEAQPLEELFDAAVIYAAATLALDEMVD